MKEMDVKILGDNVLLWQHKRDEKTAGGIILPEEKQFRPEPIADVITVGPEVKELSPGDVVIFGTYAGTEVTVDDFKYLIMKEDDILAVIT